MCGCAILRCCCFAPNDRISGIPILGYPVGIPDAFSTNGRYNGNGMHAADLREKKKKEFQKFCLQKIMKNGKNGKNGKKWQEWQKWQE